MTQIKSVAASAEKWQRRAGSAQEEYRQGVENPRSSWATNTANANAAYKKGMQESLTQDRFLNGVKAAGDTKWQKNALEKGPDRFAQGVSLAGDNYAAGYAPYASTLSSLNLPARGPKGDPANIQRVAAVAKALHDKKLSLKGSK